MRVWIVSSGIEMIPLFKFLNNFDNDYILYIDQNWFPFWEKDTDTAIWLVKKWIEQLESRWVDAIILPPVYELLFSEDSKILPVFKNYLLEQCLKYSLVWKIWFLWDLVDLEMIDNFFKKILSGYKLTDNQLNTKIFNKKFPIWKKHVPMRKYYLLQFWNRDRMVRKTIKNDLRYFKDAWVDTIIPLNYWYFAFDKIIRSKLNFKKNRFHWIDSFEWVNKKLMWESDEKNIDWKNTLRLLVLWTDYYVNSRKWLSYLLNNFNIKFINW